MNYHRGHWKKWADLVSGAVPAVGVALDLYNVVERVARPDMPYQAGGHPLVARRPWVFGGPPANEWRAADVFSRLDALLRVPRGVPGVSQRMVHLEQLLRSVPPVELEMVLTRVGPAGLAAIEDVLNHACEADEGRWHGCTVQGFYNYLLESTSPYLASLIGVHMTDSQPTTDGIEEPTAGSCPPGRSWCSTTARTALTAVTVWSRRSRRWRGRTCCRAPSATAGSSRPYRPWPKPIRASCRGTYGRTRTGP
ncbi:hypothetical protein GCM10029964_050680 [Kibdelosporangium lantanae]